MNFLLDTCFLSEGTAGPVNRGVAEWLSQTSDDVRLASVLSLAELQYGILRLTAGRRKTKLAAWYDAQLRPSLGSRILDFGESEALIWAQLRVGYPNAKTVDSQLAATAMAHDMTLVTRNVRDFKFEGLNVFNPWEP